MRHPPLLTPNIRSLASAAALSLSMSACGGGGGGEIAAIPPAPITAMPTPTPTPTTTASYKPFDQAVELSTAAYGLSGDVTIAQAPDGNYVITAFNYRPLQVGPGTNAYSFKQSSPGVFAMDVYGFGGSTFTPVDGGQIFNRASTHDSGETEVFQLSKQGAGIDLTYTRFGNYTWIQPALGANSGSGYVSFLAVGVPTIASDMPRSGTATFNGFVDGLWTEGGITRRLYGSTATMTANFGNGLLSTTLTLSGRDDPFGAFLNNAPVSLGTIYGTANIQSGTSSFTGDFNGNGAWSGQFHGGFNGPSASEYGYVFGLGNTSGALASGTVVGKRN